jgi:hypothetical protein
MLGYDLLMDLGNHDLNDVFNKCQAIGIAVLPRAASLVGRMIYGKSTLMQLTTVIHNNGF